MANSNSKNRLRVRFNDEWSLLRLKTILAYESNVRGRTFGQTVVELVLKGIDMDSYPEELREQIDEFMEQTERQAVEKALKMGRDDQLGQ